MKRSMKLIDRFHAPEDWKTRAAKIAKGKGIYAGVKTGSRLRLAIAAALVLALGLEGYSLLHGSEGERTLVPVPTESTQDEATKRYVLRQRLKNYYPIASEKGLDDIAEGYFAEGAEVFFTTDNGVADSCSQRLWKSTARDMALGCTYEPSPDGYVIDGGRLSVLFRFGDESYLDDRQGDVGQYITPHACVYDTVSEQVLKPESVTMHTTAGMMCYYVRVDIDMGEALPKSGFKGLTADLHLYSTALVGGREPMALPDTNDERIGIYHYDIKIIQNKSDYTLTSKGDAYDTLIKRGMSASEEQRIFELCGLYNDGGERTLTNPSGVSADPLLAYSYFAEHDSYAKNIDIKSDGFVTDGASLQLFFTARAPGQPGTDRYLSSFLSSTGVKAYLMPEGVEILSLDSLTDCANYTDDPHENARWLTLSIEPQYLLDGHTVEVHFVPKEGLYDDEALHYRFSYDLSRRITAERRTSLADGYTGDIPAEDMSQSPLGVLITGQDERLAALQSGGAVGYADTLSPPETAEDELLEIRTGGRGANLRPLKNPDGSSAGWYLEYRSVLGALEELKLS